MSYDASQSIDHVVRGLARFIDQFRDNKDVRGLAQSYLNRIQELENAIWEVINYRQLINAEGIQLDINGKIVGRGRNDLDDPDFLLAVRAQIRINRSSGTPEDLIDVTRLSIPDGFTFSYEEYYPCTVWITINDAVNFNIDVTHANLLRTKLGGVKLFLQFSLVPPANTFTFASGSETETDPDRGFSDAGGVTGGVWSDLK
jgi:hypothetical protein